METSGSLVSKLLSPSAARHPSAILLAYMSPEISGKRKAIRDSRSGENISRLSALRIPRAIIRNLFSRRDPRMHYRACRFAATPRRAAPAGTLAFVWPAMRDAYIAVRIYD